VNPFSLLQRAGKGEGAQFVIGDGAVVIVSHYQPTLTVDGDTAAQLLQRYSHPHRLTG